MRGWLNFRHVESYGGNIPATGKMANTAIVAGSVLLPVVLGRLTLIRIKLGLVRRMLMQLLRLLVHSGNLTVTAADLHDSVHSQRIATE